MNIFSHIGSSLYCPIQNKHKKYRLLATKKEEETILYQSPNLLQPYHQTSWDFHSSWSCREVWSYEMWHVPGDMWHTILDAWHDWNIFLFFLLNHPIELRCRSVCLFMSDNLKHPLAGALETSGRRAYW